MTGEVDGFVDSAKNGLTSKIGGVPFYVYGIGFVGAFWAYKHFVASKKTAAAVVTQDLVHPGGLPSVAGDTSGSALGPSSGVVTSGGGVNTSNTTPGQLDATTWINQGTAFLAALGYDGTKANQYLSSYTTGVQPVGEAARFVNLVLQRYGSPTQTQGYQPGATLNSPTVVRFVQRPDNVAVFAQYSDGSLHWIVNQNELVHIAQSSNNPDLWNSTTQQPVKTNISANDPLWTAAGVKFSDVYPYIPITADTPTGTYNLPPNGSTVTHDF